MCHCSKHRYAKCHFAECRYTEWCGAIPKLWLIDNDICLNKKYFYFILSLFFRNKSIFSFNDLFLMLKMFMLICLVKYIHFYYKSIS